MPATPQQPSIFTMQILWGSLFATSGLYAAVLAVTHKLDAAPQGPDMVQVGLFGGCVPLLAGFSVVLPRVLFRSAAGRTEPATREERSYADEGDHGFRQAARGATVRVLADPAAAEMAAFRTAMTPFILGMALAEAIALLGFMLGFLGGGIAFAAPFFLICMALQAMRFPTRAGVRARYEACVGARFPRD